MSWAASCRKTSASQPALFVESSIDGSLGSLEPSDTLALRPTETVAVDVFLVLDQDDAIEASDVVGVTDPGITGGVSADADDVPEPARLSALS